MAVELVVPSVGESVTEVEIGDWLKNPGDSVEEDEPVVVIETDKVTVELPAAAAGTITETLKRKGERAAVGDVIGYMEPNGKPSPFGSSQRADGRREAGEALREAEGRKSNPILRPSPDPEASPYRARASRPLPEGEGNFPCCRFVQVTDRAYGSESSDFGDITIPDFHGKSLRQVTEECLKAGLRLQSAGSGAAIEQMPPPGTSVRAGARVQVRFSSRMSQR